MKKLLLFFLLGISAYAEQTIHGNYRTSATLYYGKDAQIEILRGIVPSKFQLFFSEDSLVTWKPVSNTFTWGDEDKISTWRPSGTTTNGYLGVYTSAYGIGSYTLTDISQRITVLPGQVSSLTFSRNLVNVKDTVKLSWYSNTLTLPQTLHLQYKERGSNVWNYYTTLSVNSGTVNFVNFSKSITDIRITYTDGKYTLSEGSLTYVKPSATISKLGFDRTFSVNSTVNLSGSFSSFTGVKFLLYDGVSYQDVTNSSTVRNSTFSINNKVKSSGTYTLYVCSNEFEPLDSLKLVYKDKFLNLSPTKVFYGVNEEVKIDWFYSEDVFTNTIQFEKLTSGTWTKLVDWDVTKKTLSFYFDKFERQTSIRATVKDNVDTLTTYTSTFSISEGCKSDSLQGVISSLRRLINLKNDTLSSQVIIVDSLKVLIDKKPTSDTTVIVILKTTTGVEERILIDNISNIAYTGTDNESVYLSMNNINSIYVYNLKGENVYIDTRPIQQPVTRLDLSLFPKGLYVVVFFKDDKSYIYKFLK